MIENLVEPYYWKRMEGARGPYIHIDREAKLLETSTTTYDSFPDWGKVTGNSRPGKRPSCKPARDNLAPSICRFDPGGTVYKRGGGAPASPGRAAPGTAGCRRRSPRATCSAAAHSRAARRRKRPLVTPTPTCPN